ncbi:MAG: helix-turn-helix transcriptional regulator [Pelagibaca sp.]
MDDGEPPHEGVFSHQVHHTRAFYSDPSPVDCQGKGHVVAIHLAPREREVLLWAARGKSAWETAQMLNLSETTIKFYIRRACSRLQAQNKTHAVAVCLTNGVFKL